jgi:hypothetical protein
MLLERTRLPALDAIVRLVGMQAQAPLAPYIGLWARLAGFEARELSGLVEARLAVRANALMRVTIHLVGAADALAMPAVLRSAVEGPFAASPFARNLAGVDIDAVTEVGRSLLEERPRTLAQLGAALAQRWPESDANSLGYAVRYRVPTVQIPPRGLWGRSGPTVLATTHSWLGRPMAAEAKPDVLVLRYLAAFGPATVADVRTWSRLTGLREVLERLRPGLRTFRDERGRELFDLPDAPLPDPDFPAPPRFFPEYDNALLSHDDRTRIIPPGMEHYLFYPAGNGGLTGGLTIDGFLAGRWRLRRSEERTILAVETPGRLSVEDRAEIEAEAESLLRFVAPDATSRAIELTQSE